MKKQFCILIVLLTIFLFPFISKAQTNYEDVVYLKNGSIIHGIIIEQIPNQSIKIQTKDKNLFVFKIEEIEKITKEQVNITKEKVEKTENNGIKQSGYTNITEMFLGWDETSIENSFYGIQTINGYLFNPNFSIGLGIGVDQYVNVTFIPVFVDFRANLLKTKITPFISAGMGYSSIINSTSTDSNGYTINRKGGILLNLATGVKFFVSRTLALNFSIGYRFQEYTYFDRYYGGSLEYYSGSFDYFNLKLGITF